MRPVAGGRQGPTAMNDADLLTCSARDCREPAIVKLLWNNPKIHAAERRKVWLACADHQESLTGFLAARGFMRSAEPV